MVTSDSKLGLEGQCVNRRPLARAYSALTFDWRQGAQTVEQHARWIAGRPASGNNVISETKARRPIGILSLSGIDTLSLVGEPWRLLIGDEEGAQGLSAADYRRTTLPRFDSLIAAARLPISSTYP